MLAKFSRVLEEQLRQKDWEKLKSLPQARPPAPGGPPTRMRAGIMGIERDIHQKQSRASTQVSEAFKDLDALIGKVLERVAHGIRVVVSDGRLLRRHALWWRC